MNVHSNGVYCIALPNRGWVVQQWPPTSWRAEMLVYEAGCSQNPNLVLKARRVSGEPGLESVLES